MSNYGRFLKLIHNSRAPFPRLVKTVDGYNYKVASLSRINNTVKDRLCRQLIIFCTHLVKLKRYFSHRMSDKSTSCPFSLPPSIRGMKVLDRDAFSVISSVAGLKVPTQSVSAVRQRYKHWLLKVPKLPPIAQLSDDDAKQSTHRLFLFSPNHVQLGDAFGEDDRTFLSKYGVDLADIQQYTVKLTYENFSYDDVLDAVLPRDYVVGGFSIIGHIAHLNLKDEQLEYKNIIGQVILDKLPNFKTVVHKTQSIDNTFRNFAMEVIAGEPNFITVAREHGFRYKLDFSKVYWNPRLATEHQRIVKSLNHGDVLYDVFAGVGPFAVPAAKKGCQVFANDLNSESVHWLRHNLDLNKVTDKVEVHNMDGEEFISSVIKSDLLEHWRSTAAANGGTCHIVMNLPSLAVDFLKFFRGLLSDGKLPIEHCIASLLPVIHCYTFSRADDPVTDAAERTAAALCVASFEDLQERNVRVVRNVAPGKEMLCVTFRLPWHVLTSTDSHVTIEEPGVKRLRTS